MRIDGWTENGTNAMVPHMELSDIMMILTQANHPSHDNNTSATRNTRAMREQTKTRVHESTDQTNQDGRL